MSTNTSSASSPWPRARRAASTTRPSPSSPSSSKCCEPYKGRVYDPAMGSGGFFVQSEKLHRGTRRQARQHLRLRPGIQPHHLAPGRHEHGHPRHRLQLRQGARQHLHQRPAPRPARRLRHGQSALQHEGVEGRRSKTTTRAGNTAPRPPATPTSPGCSTCSTTWRPTAAWPCCSPTAP